MKNADKIKNALLAFRFLSASSIIQRLTISYSWLTLTALLLVSGLLYWLLASNFERTNNEFMVDQIHVLRKILKERPDDLDALRQEVEWEVTARRIEKYYARILDEQGHIIIETPGMAEIVLPSLFPKPIGVEHIPEKGVRKKGQDGRPLLLMAAWDEASNSHAPKRLHQIALDISHDEAILSNYRRNMVIILLVGTLFSVAAAVLVAHKGLRPLERITNTAQRITATRLNERIAPAQWPTELAAPAAAFTAKPAICWYQIKKKAPSSLQLKFIAAKAMTAIRTNIAFWPRSIEWGLPIPTDWT
ncbi:MAG: hypothetical protein ACREOI_08585 [bacterium]